MRQLTIRRHKNGTIHNAFGEVVMNKYYYTIAYRNFLLWRHFKFYPVGNKKYSMARRCLEANSVLFNEMPALMATHFESEADAIRVKFDMTQNPNKYIT